MLDWGKERKRGKRKFVILFALGISLPLLIDYYLIKYFLRSFKLEFMFFEILVVWFVSIILGLFFGLYSWRKLEIDWLSKDKSGFIDK